MVTYFMCKEFYKSGEFDFDKNEYVGFEMLVRVPVFIMVDLLLIFNIFF